MWTSSQPEFDALVKQVLSLKADLEEYKKRLDYVEEALLLPDERERLDEYVRGLRQRHGQ